MASPQVQIDNEVALRFVLRAFRHPNYRLFFGGQGISLIGTWMQQIAMSWLVYHLTNSAFMLGLVGFAGQVPTFLFAAPAGVIVDRWNRHHLLILMQTLAMLQAFALAALTLTGTVQVWHIIVLSVFLGTINAFEITTRQSFVVEIIEQREDLGNAIALNSFMFNGARLVGPAVAGLLIGLLGEGICFLINGVSFLAIIGSLLMMKIRPGSRPAEEPALFQGLKEGYRYAFGFPPIRYILILLALMSFAGMPYLVLMPIFARDVLSGGPETLGFLMGASGVGALMGALYLASHKTILGLGKLVVAASTLLGCGLVGFALSPYFPLSLGMMLLTGFGMMVMAASSNTIIQTIVDEDKRGRVMSFFVMAFLGAAPFGNLIAGSLASHIGAPATLVICGVCCIGGSFYFLSRLPLMRKEMRPIYVQLGIVREMPTEVE